MRRAARFAERRGSLSSRRFSARHPRRQSPARDDARPRSRRNRARRHLPRRKGLMTTTTESRSTFTDEQFAELVDLIKDSDTVELKLTVPESHQRSTAAALGMDPLAAQIRQVYF